ncbi:MAG: ASCH domain-containing protein [Limisphaerales bacterium]
MTKLIKRRPRIRPVRWSSTLLELRAISIRQPFSWLVVNGVKDIENRSWRTNIRGPVLVHASLNQSELASDTCDEAQSMAGIRLPDDFVVGGIVGIVEIVDCVRRHSSKWKEPTAWGWVLANARPLKFRQCKGAVGFFRPHWG